MSTKPTSPPPSAADLPTLYLAVKKEILNRESLKDAIRGSSDDVYDCWENFIAHVEPFLEKAGDGMPWQEKNRLQAVAGTIMGRPSCDTTLCTATKALLLLAEDATTPHKAEKIRDRVPSPDDHDAIAAVAGDYLNQAAQVIQAARAR